jgi:hypothetical protein
MNGAHSREMIIITYKKEDFAYRTLKKELSKREIDQNYYRFHKSSNPCSESYPKSILHMCLSDEGTLDLVSQNIEVLRRMYDDNLLK